MPLFKRKIASIVREDERGNARDYVGLTAQLSSDNPEARRWAARDLLIYPQATSVLAARLLCEDDRSVREVIFTSLTRLSDDIAVACLVECLRSEDAQIRNDAIEAMKALPHEVAPIMSGLLVDADPDVRIMAINILESLRHPKIEDWLIGVIEHDLVVNVCSTAVDLLGEVGSLAAQEALLRLKQRFAEEPYIQFSANIALKRIVNA